MRKALATLVALLALALVGCDDGESFAEEDLRLGIQCRDAGGEWVFIPEAGVNEQGIQFCQFLKE